MKIKNDETVYYDGILVLSAIDDPKAFLQFFSESALLPDVLEVVLTEEEENTVLRKKISETAGDTLSLLGTTSDASQLLLYWFFDVVSKISEAKNIAEIKAAVEPYKGIAKDFQSRVETGEVELPALLKGVPTVIQDIETRATFVAKAMRE